MEGTPVSKGQLIGYVGDSGNAECGRHPISISRSGSAASPINPYPYLLNAPRLTGTGGTGHHSRSANNFTDDDDSPHEADIEILYARGVTLGCGPSIYCPNDAMTRGQIALFISRQLALPPVDIDYYDDDQGSQYEVASELGDCGRDRVRLRRSPLLSGSATAARRDGRVAGPHVLARTVARPTGSRTTTARHSKRPSTLSRKPTSPLGATRPTRPLSVRRTR